MVQNPPKRKLSVVGDEALVRLKAKGSDSAPEILFLAGVHLHVFSETNSIAVNNKHSSGS